MKKNKGSVPKLNASSRILYQEAIHRGIKCTAFNDHETILMKKGNKSWYTRGSRTSLQSSVGRTIANNKFLTKQILTHFKLPTANYVKINHKDEINTIKKLKFPIVMKPLSGAHGRGVIVGIQNIQDTKKYLKTVKLPVLFEEQVNGTEYRILCIDYKFIAATFRKNAFVTGDGQQSIEQLIQEKNKHPWRKPGHKGNLTSIKIDHLVKSYIKKQGYTLKSIPAKNQEVILRKTCNLSTGGEPHDVTDLVCKENKQLFSKISKVCDLNTIGIDFMCQDLSKPYSQQNCTVIEVNASPGLRMHHFPLKGKPINAAGFILDMVESKL